MISPRSLMAAAAAVATLHTAPAIAQSSGACVATETMRSGANNYVPNAPIIENLGTGWTLTGIVREAGTCAPLANVRVQVWSATDRGGEREPSNHGSVLTDAKGRYTMEISEVRPSFGQPHVHIAFVDPNYQTLFLRSVLGSDDREGMTVDFVVQPMANSDAQPSG
ncbi:twin-arginine translocation pathway signal [Ensifer sp. YR511]|uniref:twin-arginine translocation pathway signal n=1 Tax=Ensifer sp. YR511 TaxID=1855294 RepID=UPI000884D29A|nr:twin-arginine translocation pathway signal [Ensifer sp. YR511]SDN03007.1 hypothetical protein SAMN05216328_11734 [Ensifer sp. YR511]